MSLSQTDECLHDSTLVWRVLLFSRFNWKPDRYRNYSNRSNRSDHFMILILVISSLETTVLILSYNNIVSRVQDTIYSIFGYMFPWVNLMFQSIVILVLLIPVEYTYPYLQLFECGVDENAQMHQTRQTVVPDSPYDADIEIS